MLSYRNTEINTEQQQNLYLTYRQTFVSLPSVSVHLHVALYFVRLLMAPSEPKHFADNTI